MSLTTGERLFAEGAALATRFAPARRLLAGPRGDRITWLGFHVAHATADELPLTRFEGGPVASRNRSAWPVGVLAVKGTILGDALNEYRGARLGYAWNSRVLGSAVLVGMIPDKHVPERGKPFVAGVCIGSEDLYAGLAIVSRDGSLAVISRGETPESVGRPEVRPRYNNPAEVQALVPVY